MPNLELLLAAETPEGRSNLNADIALLVVYASIALVFSFLCSVAEAVLLSVTPSHIATLKEQGKKSAELLEHLKDNIDRPLAAILSLNTLAHTVGAAGVGAQAAAIWGSTSVGLASAAMTLLILVLSEIIPKTIGALYWRGLAPATARLVRILIWVLLPLVWLCELLTKLIGDSSKQEIITREEVAAMAALSTEAGDMKAEERQVVHNLLRLDSLSVEDIMTPRTVILACPEDMTVGQFLEQRPHLPVSRIPIYDGSIDRTTGFVLKTDVLLTKANGQPDTQLRQLRRDLKAIPATASLSALFELLLKQREHVALVIDEYGGTDGLVTMEDLLETLLGMEIVDEADVAADMQRLARQRWEYRIKSLGLEVTDSSDNEKETDNPAEDEADEQADAGE